MQHSLEESGIANTPSWFGARALNARSRVRQVGAIVLQVDSAVTRVHGLTWLINQRESAVLRQLADLQGEAAASGWTPEQLVSARLGVIRPRRSEINALGQAYLQGMAPGVADAAHHIRRAGIAVGLSGDVAVEALFGIATALGVTPDDIRAPTIRFDALGSYIGSDLARRSGAPTAGARGAMPGAGCVFIGARPPEFGMRSDDAFIRFTGFVQQEGKMAAPVLDSVASFSDLVAMVAG